MTVLGPTEPERAGDSVMGAASRIELGASDGMVGRVWLMEK